MKNFTLIAIASLLVSAPFAQANENLAMLNTSQAIALAQFNMHKATPSKSMRAYLIKSRRKDTLEDFSAMMSKSFPANFRMMTTLNADTQSVVYTSYKRGERLTDLRKQVITYYSSGQQI